jgi:putative colanic acid biosynthesis UDP-glucose lipid carrier transferase
MKFSKFIPFLALAGDLFLLNGFFIGGYIYFSNKPAFAPENLLFFIYLNVAWLCISLVFGAGAFDRHISKIKILTTSIQVIVFFFFAFLMYFQLVKNYNYISRDEIKYIFPMYFAGLLVWKYFLYFSFATYRKKGYNFRNVAMLGITEPALKLQEFISDNIWYGYRFSGFITIENETHDRVLGGFNEMEEILRNNHIDEIFISLEKLSSHNREILARILNDSNIKVRLIPDFKTFSFKMVERLDFGDIPVLALHPGPLSLTGNYLIKRCFDIVFSLLVIVSILSWLIPLFVIIDLLTDRGGAFFVQKRTSINGRNFSIIKFRSMVHNERADTDQAVDGDQRITAFGRFIRNTSIDELPQFINVFLGHMSVVGPRPHMLKHTEEYANLVKSYVARHAIKPGITGLAQVKGFRGEIKTVQDIARRVEYDLFYIRNWSPGLDMYIIWQTILLLFASFAPSTGENQDD